MKITATGQPLLRVDGRAKVTGAARYSAEVQIAGLAYGVLVTSKSARGRILSIETDDAEREPGVLAVITPRNALRLPDPKVPENDRVVQVLQDDRIVYSNQPVALVVAETLEGATHAALLVKVHEEKEPATVRLDDELARAFPHDLQSSAGKQPADQIRGDPARGLREADARLEETYQTPYQTHNPLEPHATTAAWSAPDRLTVYDATQGVFGVRKKLAKMFGLAPANVRVLTKFVGGGFGCKGAPWSHVVLAALAAKQVGRPVKLVLTRPQMFGMVGGRPVTRQRIAAGASKQGKLTVLKHESVSTTSRFDDFLEPAAAISRHQYACENVETRHRLVRLDIATPTYMRAPGESTGSFALESAIDELAHALGLDPLALRLASYAETDPTENKPFSSKSLRCCYQEGARRFGWTSGAPGGSKTRAALSRPRTRDGMLVGIGMATSSYPANFGKAEALARMLPDGSAEVRSGAVDLGGGTYTVMGQVAADAIGLAMDKVRFDLGDTQMPEAPRSGGSQTAASCASAVLLAGRALRDRLVRMAVMDPRSPLLGARPDEVLVEDGRMSANGRADTFADVVRRAGGAPVEERSKTGPDEARKKWSMHSFGAQFVEVLVDPDLGHVRVKRLVGVFSGGRILNARTARSQLIGGMVWGIGMALHEHTVYDEKLGRIMTRDLADYHLPTHADVPSIEAYLVEEEDLHVDPAGVKGIGEIGITGTAAAIANAVFNATGKRVRSLPITPDKLL